MKANFKFSKLRYCAVLITALFLTACSGVQTSSGSLENRVQARWDALLAGDFEKAYSYLSPGYRSSVSPSDFEIGFRLRKVIYTSAEYVGQECLLDSCTVETKLGYRLIGALRGVNEWNSKQVVEETWVRIDDQWWFLPKN